MIFRPELAKKIRVGSKTMTRRQVKPGEMTCRYEPGKAYAVQPGRGKTATCRITVRDVRQERVGQITLKDAKREGFNTTTEFLDYWQALHAKGWAPQRDGESDEQFQARRRDQGCWPALAHAPVWVIAFALGDHTDTPRFLSARIGGAGGDYTTVAALGAQGEGEPLSETETEHYGKLAHAKAETTGLTVLRRKRDVLAAAIEDIASDIPSDPGPWRDRIRRFQRELSLMNQLLEDKVAA
jgi:uncharacterized protein YhfF